jgi:hypothetical protein
MVRDMSKTTVEIDYFQFLELNGALTSIAGYLEEISLKLDRLIDLTEKENAARNEAEAHDHPSHHGVEPDSSD